MLCICYMLIKAFILPLDGGVQPLQGDDGGAVHLDRHGRGCGGQ